MRRFRIPKIALGLIAVFAIGAPTAFAADDSPTLTAKVIDDIVIVSAKHFPSSADVAFKATVDGGSGSSTVKSSASGRALIAFEPPADFAGSISVSAESGTSKATATVTFGSSTPTTGPTTTAVPTTAVPATPTTAPPASTVPTTTAPATPVPSTTPPATGNVLPVGVPGNWSLKFSDEFNGPTLDTQKWITCYPKSGPEGCDHSNGEQQWYQPQNVSVTDGALHMTGKKEASHGYPYTSGMVTTGGPAQYTYQYGYFESRFKVPAGQGYWPALWLLPASGGWPPEIDLMEILGHKTDEVHMTLHWGGENKARGGSGEHFNGVDFATGWHTMGVDWQKDKITWYLDGKVARTVYSDTTNIPHEPMYLLANLAIGGQWPGNPDASTQFPQSFDVDYIRVWQ